MTPGRLIVFEGPDGVGKSTVAGALQEALTPERGSVLLLAFPGNEAGSVGELVYRLHHAPHDFGIEQLNPACLQALHVAAHIDSIIRVIMPALKHGTWVVLDRYWWSTWVYGRFMGVPPVLLDSILEAERVCWGETRPDILFLISRSSAVGTLPDDSQRSHLEALYREVALREADGTNIRQLTNDENLNVTLENVLAALAETCSDLHPRTVP